MPLTKERKKAYVEVCEVLNHMTKTDVEKIPKEILEYYSDNADKKYNFKIDETKTLAEQNLSYTAKVVLAMFYRDYWATQEERDNITKKEKADIEKQKAENQTNTKVLYTLDNTAKIATIKDNDDNTDSTVDINNNENIKKPEPISQIISGVNKDESQQPIKAVSKEKWYSKLINILKDKFNIKKGT